MGLRAAGGGIVNDATWAGVLGGEDRVFREIPRSMILRDIKGVIHNIMQP